MIINNWKKLITYGMLVVPALGVLYLATASIWGLPFGEQISATCQAITVFLGVLTKISSKNYDNRPL